MKSLSGSSVVRSTCAILPLYLFTGWSMAQAACDKPVGHFVSLQSTVEVQRNNSANWQTAESNSKLCEGDSIRVGSNSRAAVQLVNDAVLRLDQNTTMRLINITRDANKERSVLEVIKGIFKSFSRDPHHLTIQTPYLNGLIEGTEYLVQVDETRTSILLLEGKIIAKNDQGSVTITPGQMASAGGGEAPKTSLLAKPRDAVQWALHYPSVISFVAEDFAGDSDWENAVQQSIRSHKAGRLAEAFSSIADVTDAADDARFFVYRAALSLSVGRIDNASKDLEQALALSADNNSALSLKAIIQVAKNARDEALVTAARAVELAPDSSEPLIALSYAQQAGFDLDGARSSLEKAVQLNSNNALAWARLAEIYSSLNLRGKSLAAASKATALDPDLSRAQTVLGFVQLTRMDSGKAMIAFDKAIKQDQADPLPHLGLGLALIAEGELQAGRGELDVAAILDPNQAIIRSYLGKAYYQENRDHLAMQQFAIARELDPNDPTPWFYQALAEQADNQPAEAMQSMDKAIDLNDNRAVYRSRLLLDSDRAARSTSLASIYNDLGFDQLALVEGWKATITDPSNSAGHRYLADSYAALPNHEIARVSELLQSQLLQPLSMVPVRPQQAESNLYLANASGLGAASFNEFNNLFHRDGHAELVGFTSGANNTQSAETVVAGVIGNFGYSVGGYHFGTDGFRENADQRTDLGNVFAQWDITPDTSIQAEHRSKDMEYGDLQLKYFTDNYQPGEVHHADEDMTRLGFRSNLTAGSALLASLIQLEHHAYGGLDPSPSGLIFLADESQTVRSGELQYLYRSPRFNLTAGIAHFDRDSHELASLYAPPPIPGIPPILLAQVDTDTDIHHTNGYLYANISPIDSLSLTLGLSSEHNDSDTSDVFNNKNDGEQHNPKFGLIWSPTKSSSLRLAAFRAVKRPVAANQTLEPTQVAGFNQFFDDYNDTIFRRKGVAFDQSFTPRLHGGLEYSERTLEIPQYGFSDIANWEQTLGRVYLFWTPARWMGLKLEYQKETIDRKVQFDGVHDANTDHLYLGMKVFLPSGWSMSLNPSYHAQTGTFDNVSVVPAVTAEGKDNFWLMDVALNRRLPGRLGLFSAGARNLFDREFEYFDMSHKNPSLLPGRTAFVSITMTLQ